VIQNTTQQSLKQLSLGLGLLGLFCGFLAAYGVLAGDGQGRVNLLFLLLLFAFVPVVGLVLSLILLIKGGGKGLAGWILDIPLWPRHLTLALLQLGIHHSRELWLFYQTQILALSFSVGSLLLYLLLLLGTDITFVWRSTLLTPDDLLPTLQVIALPWSFWPEAQASLALIEQTQDFRLESQGMAQPAVGLWWQYILAAQLFYNLVPRSLMLLVARHKYLTRLQRGSAQQASAKRSESAALVSDNFPLANLVSAAATPYTLLDWANAPAACHEQIQKQLGAAAASHHIDPLSQADESQWEKSQSLVVLVKSWEPPLAELADKLNSIENSADKLILPMDWNAAGVRQPTPTHLEEWRRFAATLPNWQVLNLETTI
jgi:hypothetical protein